MRTFSERKPSGQWERG